MIYFVSDGEDEYVDFVSELICKLRFSTIDEFIQNNKERYRESL